MQPIRDGKTETEIQTEEVKKLTASSERLEKLTEELSKSSKRLERYTGNLVFLTVVLIILTIVLIIVPSDSSIYLKEFFVVVAVVMVAYRYRKKN